MRTSPYWSEIRDRWPAPATGEPPATADLVVVGGGIAGLMAALWSARLGADTVLLEAGALAGGATSRNIGLMLFGGELDRLDTLAELRAGGRIAERPRATWHLSLLESADLVEVVTREAANGDAVELLDRERCAAFLGTTPAARFLAGRRARNAMVVDPVGLASGVASAAVAAGARLFPRHAVVRVAPGSGGVLVELGRGSVRCRAAVLAAGPATGTLTPGAEDLLLAREARVWQVEAERGMFPAVMAVNFGDVYWRQLPDGTVLVGGLARDVAPAAFFRDAFPLLPPVRPVRSWTGTMAVTRDGRPLLGPAPGAPGVWLLTGFGGHGLPPAATASKLVVRAALGHGESLAAVSGRYGPDRFRRAGAVPADRWTMAAPGRTEAVPCPTDPGSDRRTCGSSPGSS